MNVKRGETLDCNWVNSDAMAVAISDPSNPTRYFQVRDRVVSTTMDGVVDHIEMLS